MTTPDRSAIMRYAWTLHREARADREQWHQGLAVELYSRRGFINAATSPADRAKRIATIASSYRQFVAHEPPPVPFSDWLRVAWHEARRSAPSPITGERAARMAADALP